MCLRDMCMVEMLSYHLLGVFDTTEVIISFKTGDKHANMSARKQKFLHFRWRVEI